MCRIQQKAAEVASSNFKYETNGTSSISITGYTGIEGVVTIPNQIDGYTVTQIAKEAFKENKIISSVTIPDTVKIINDSAFNGCTMLESVTMGNGVKELGSYAFGDCTKLSSVKLSSVLTTVNSAAFYNCTALESISIPASLKTYEHSYSGMFEGCTNLHTVIFEEGTKVVPEYILSDCGVENVTIPNTVIQIDTSAFARCAKLKSVVIPDSVKELGSYTFSDCTNLSNVKLSSSLTTVNSAVFNNCTALKSILIPASLKTYEHSYNGMFEGCTNLYTVIFEEGTKVVPEYILSDCGVENVTIPNTVTQIDASAFSGCSNLKSIVIPDSVKELGAYTFSDCINLSSVKLSSSLTTVNSAAFNNCTALESVLIPASIGIYKHSYNGMFEGCTHLYTIVFEEGVKAIPEYIFQF